MPGGETHTHREDGQVTGAEIGVRQLQAKKCQGLPVTTRSQERGKEEFSFRAFRQSMALLTS